MKNRDHIRALPDEAELAAEEREYTVDELAAASGVPTRTIRFYQSSGALPRPEVRGRIAYYGKIHIDRLRLIADLKDRGLRIKAIRELLSRSEASELDIREWLGLDEQIAASWAGDQPRVCSEDELYQLIGSRRSGLLADLQRLRLADRQGDSFLVRSPALLRIAMELQSSGVDLDTAYGGAAIIRKYAARAARDVAKYFFKRAGEGFEHDANFDELLEAFRAARPLGQQALQLIFGQEMDRVIRDMVKAGKTTQLAKKRKRTK
ncbi:MAG: MerR family transcriptional regulator [Deltaproteobacteria bacterium]|nr:MerR family transcriptional regulator [Deltaproteobacteria bacterium]